MEFVKMHGLGNDFIIARAGQPDLKEDDYSYWAEKLCDRHFGIGADGLVIIGADEDCDLFMRIFNSDGSEAEMCGNVTRCVARIAWEEGMVKKENISIRTLSGPKYAQLLLDGEQVKAVRVDMGEPRFKAEAIPVKWPESPVINGKIVVEGQEFEFSAVSMGNPHCVIKVPDAENFPLRRFGPLIEKHELFPQKTNVEFISIIDKSHVVMRVWERGAGETLACGTGACAAAVCAHLNGFTEREATVHLKGGDLFIEWGEDNHVYMTGPAALVFKGMIDLANFKA